MDDPDVLKIQKMLTDIQKAKPPIGKQQIMDLSNAAFQATKHFKHVVHLIEKFILKAKSPYKLYGFFMIDAIIRKAQKKFKHKDCWAPRFAVNLRQTLVNALSCPTKDKPKIVRVLNLWRANGIFGDEILRPLIQHCRAMGLDVDIEVVEKAVKGEKADLSRYGSTVTEGSSVKAPPTAPAAIISGSGVSSSSSNPDASILKLLSSVNSEYDKFFSSNPRALRKVQDLIGDNLKKTLGSQSKNKIQNILSAEFDYSDESDDENKTAVDINSLPKEQLDKATEALFKNSSILSEIRSIFQHNSEHDSHGNSSKFDDKDRKRKRSRSSSRDRKDSDRKRDRSRRSYRKRSSTPRHRDNDKRERERRKLGFPLEPKREHFLIASRTLWIGRLPANCSESEIKNALVDYGTPDSIQIINSRACCYVTMPDRRSAYKIIDKMYNKLEISRKTVKTSWATGQGLKDDSRLNVFWVAEHGYHEIPWASLPPKIDHLFEGSYADIDTLPPKFKDMYDEKGKLLKPKSPILPPSEQPSLNNLSHVPLPPPEHHVNLPPTGVPPPQLQNFQSNILPPGLTLPPTLDGKDGSLELLMAVANSNNAQAGILGARPQLNPALLNTLNALNVRPPQLMNLNRPPFPRYELPDQQAAFQQFNRGGARPFHGGFHNQNFAPRNGFNNGNRYPLPDTSKPPPSIAETQPLSFNNIPRMPLENFSQPPPIINSAGEDEPMDIASPDNGPPGV